MHPIAPHSPDPNALAPCQHNDGGPAWNTFRQVLLRRTMCTSRGTAYCTSGTITMVGVGGAIDAGHTSSSLGFAVAAAWPAGID